MRTLFRRAAVATLVAAAAAFGCAPGAGESPRLAWLADEALGGTVDLSGLDAAQLRALEAADGDTVRVFVGGAAEITDDRLPVLGNVTVDRGRAHWQPRYALRPGQSYTAVWTPSTAAAALTATYAVPARDVARTTVVTAAYPAAEVVPENLLRVYVQFSAPMSRGQAQRHLELTDAAGVAISGAFVLPEQELWSPDSDRLTLFFDPGRLKQEVGPNLTVGTPLRAGMDIVLRVAQDWHDANGAPLAQPFERRWRVGAADRTQPDPRTWRVLPPTDPTAAVELELGEALDRGQMERLMMVESSAGARIAGTIEVSGADRRWRFTPTRPWEPGSYVVRVDSVLEDLAGNSTARLFDEPLVEDRVGAPRMAAIRLPFEVAG